MIKKLPRSSGNILAIEVIGKNTGEDDREFRPEIDKLLDEHGTARILIVLKDFKGCDLSGFWEEVKMCLAYYKKLERIAVVGDKLWEKIMVKLDSHFEHAEEKYFDMAQLEDAWRWIESPVED